MEMVDFERLSLKRLKSMADAGERILECHRVLQKTDANIVGELLATADEFFEWDHYPDGDVYDHETHSQYYYHAHPPEDREKRIGAEHGHFHLFLRPRGMPKDVKPAPLADYKKPKGKNDALSHLIGISMNRAGYPIRLFTTNRWVTGEVWYPAKDVIKMLGLFNMDLAWPSWPVNIWVTNMVRLFRPNIEELLRQRDQTVAGWEQKSPGENVYEDRKQDITSLEDISVEKQITGVFAAIDAKKTKKRG